MSDNTSLFIRLYLSVSLLMYATIAPKISLKSTFGARSVAVQIISTPWCRRTARPRCPQRLVVSGLPTRAKHRLLPVRQALHPADYRNAYFGSGFFGFFIGSGTLSAGMKIGLLVGQNGISSGL